MIKKNCAPIAQFRTGYKSLLKNIFHFDNNSADKKLETFLQTLRDDLFVVLESPYTDKLYRDTYYNFYAARHQTFDRDCIRICLFSKSITPEDIYAPGRADSFQDAFLGFFILRPLKGRTLGRSMISPKALKTKNFLTCLSRSRISFFGQSLYVDAYPHSTQDVLTISCAETCLWNIMEYFGHRYAEYGTILPSDIYSILQDTYHQRSIPSNGLTALQLSTALRQFSFGTQLYAVDRKRERRNEIHAIISTYVESGIPVIIFISGEEFGAHTIVLIGHENIEKDTIEEGCKPTTGPIDSANFPKRFIGADDNRPIYQSINLNTPLAEYTESKYHGGEIVSVIVPLYEKIYLDAIKARKLIYHVIADKTLGWKRYSPNTHIARILLTSSRAFKQWLRDLDNIPKVLREMLLGMHLPRFVWLAEYATKENYLQGKADCLVCLDATGDDSPESLLFSRYPEYTFWLNSETGTHDKIDIPSPATKVYQNNLKGEWNGWKST